MQIKEYGYHITSYENLDSIKELGLIPMVGERSEEIGERHKAVYFYPILLFTPLWVNALYRKEEI